MWHSMRVCRDGGGPTNPAQTAMASSATVAAAAAAATRLFSTRGTAGAVAGAAGVAAAGMRAHLRRPLAPALPSRRSLAGTLLRPRAVLSSAQARVALVRAARQGPPQVRISARYCAILCTCSCARMFVDCSAPTCAMHQSFVVRFHPPRRRGMLFWGRWRGAACSCGCSSTFRASWYALRVWSPRAGRARARVLRR